MKSFSSVDSKEYWLHIYQITTKMTIEAFHSLLERGNLQNNEYQSDGVQWCLNQETHSTPICGVRGGFIADEMGLGKTLMMVGTIASNSLNHTLIVVPPALIDQWLKEMSRSLSIKPFVFHGPNVKKCTDRILSSNTVVITTYDTISITANKLPNLIHKMVWDRIIFDEGHYLRNKRTSRFRGVMLLKTKISWIISGTPIQNRKEDFYNLCSVLGLPAEFYENPLNLNTITRTFVLRRTKKDVGLNVPALHITNNIVDWTDEHEKFLSSQIHNKLNFVTSDNDSPSSAFHDLTPFTAMIRAKQMCVFPRMLKKMVSKEQNQGLLLGCESSSKLDKIVDTILKNKNTQKGKLVFCQFRLEIDEIKRRLLLGGYTDVQVLDGRTPRKDRLKILEEKHEVIILQMRTGCEGLNLQEHNSEIYLTSPNWNPFNEDQAIARCHRLGQKNVVFVYKFEMSNGAVDQNRTIDRYITEVQDSKRTIAQELF